MASNMYMGRQSPAGACVSYTSCARGAGAPAGSPRAPSCSESALSAAAGLGSCACDDVALRSSGAAGGCVGSVGALSSRLASNLGSRLDMARRCPRAALREACGMLCCLPARPGHHTAKQFQPLAHLLCHLTHTPASTPASLQHSLAALEHDNGKS